MALKHGTARPTARYHSPKINPLFGNRCMPAALAKVTFIAALLVQLVAAPFARSEEVQNLTGLPVYPNLSKAMMDGVVRTGSLGRWCSRFAAETFYPIEMVESWYRKAMLGASETDLTHDERYRNFFRLSGIKLARGIDYVNVYRVANQTSTSIELFRCSAPGA